MTLRNWTAVLFLLGLGACAGPQDAASQSGTNADASAPAASPTTLTMDGLGPVRLGMSVAEAEQALQTSLVAMSPGEEACWQTRRADGQAPQIFYMVENGRITRIDIENTSGAPTPEPAIGTAKGIGIGAAEADVIDAYGPSTEVMPHKYDENGHYLVVHSADARSALVFETSDGKVTTFRTGFQPSVDYVEGCS